MPQSDDSIASPKKRELKLPRIVGADVESTVGFAGEDTAVFGSIEFLEKTARRASYVVKIVNDSSEDLYCARFGERGSQRTELRPSEFVVESHAASAVIVDVPLRLWSPFDSVLVTMRNRMVHCSLNAEVPLTSYFIPLMAGLSSIALLIIGLTAFALSKPDITAYAVPSALLAGSPVRAAYTVRGIGTASYEIADIGDPKNIEVLASGTLAPGQGFFTFNTPPKPGKYRLSLRMNGLLGNVSEDQLLQTVAASNAGILQLIRAFEVDDALVQSGNPIVARYITNGKGQVRLLDTSQIPVAVQTTSPHGMTAIPAPAVDKDTPYRLELTAKSGKVTQTASLGIVVQPGTDMINVNGDSVTTQGSLSALSTKDVATIDAASNAAGASKFLRIDPPYVLGGSTFHVSVLASISHLQVTLQNAQGVPLTTRTAAPTQRVLSFTVPPVGVDSNFLLVANFQLNGTNQTVIKPFTVYVR